MSLIAAGRKARQRKDEGFSATTLREAGYLPLSLKYAGFSLQELKRAGFTSKELKGAGYSPRAINPRAYGEPRPVIRTADMFGPSGDNGGEEEAAHSSADLQQLTKKMRSWQRKIEVELAKATETIRKQSDEIAALKHRVAPTLRGSCDANIMHADPERESHRSMPWSASAAEAEGPDEEMWESREMAAARVKTKKLREEESVREKAEQDAAAAKIQIKYKTKKEAVAERPAQFCGVDALLASIESMAVAPLRGRFLLQLAKEGTRVERRQDLPAHAFWTASELRELLEKLSKLPGLNAKQAERRLLMLFHTLACPWLSPEHCDPNRTHLEIIAEVVEARLCPGSNTLCANVFEPLGLHSETADCILFWDFCSLYQPKSLDDDDRTPDELELFREGSAVTHVWFGHERTTVWMQTEMPATHRGLTFSQSGWCACESWMSNVVKAETAARLDLGLRNQTILKEPESRYAIRGPPPGRYLELKKKCEPERTPPMAPDRAASLLNPSLTKGLLHFDNEQDRDLCFELYRSLFVSLAPVKQELIFTAKALKLASGERWSVSDFRSLADALPFFRGCKVLDFDRHPMGDDACKTIMEALADKTCMPALETLRMCHCRLGDKSGQAIADAFRKRGKTAVRVLELLGNQTFKSSTIKKDVRFHVSKAAMTVSGIDFDEGFGTTGK